MHREKILLFLFSFLNQHENEYQYPVHTLKAPRMAVDFISLAKNKKKKKLPDFIPFYMCITIQKGKSFFRW